MKKFLYFILFLPLCQYCTQKSTSKTSAGFRANPLPDSTQIYFLHIGEPLPDSSEFVRDLPMGQSMFSSSNCSYKKLMNYAKFTARQSGANLIKITQLKNPAAMGNGCYQITAKLYKNLEGADMADFVRSREKVNKSKLPETADYAVVYFYRPKFFQGAAISYEVMLDGKVEIGKASNGAKLEYKITEFGKHKFSAKTTEQDNVTIDIKKGEEYYIRCGTADGKGIASPDLYLMDNYLGREEYSEMR